MVFASQWSIWNGQKKYYATTDLLWVGQPRYGIKNISIAYDKDCLLS